jgi:hypothetical protein
VTRLIIEFKLTVLAGFVLQAAIIDSELPGNARACLVGPRDSPRWLTLQIGSLVPIADIAVKDVRSRAGLARRTWPATLPSSIAPSVVL